MIIASYELIITRSVYTANCGRQTADCSTTNSPHLKLPQKTTKIFLPKYPCKTLFSRLSFKERTLFR